MTGAVYERPRIVDTRHLSRRHRSELEASAIDPVEAGLAGVSSVDHAAAYDLGIRSDGDLAGLCFRYWEPWSRRFSNRFARVKPDVRKSGRKYLQPVGEKPKLYFIADTPAASIISLSITRTRSPSLRTRWGCGRGCASGCMAPGSCSRRERCRSRGARRSHLTH